MPVGPTATAVAVTFATADVSRGSAGQASPANGGTSSTSTRAFCEAPSPTVIPVSVPSETRHMMAMEARSAVATADSQPAGVAGVASAEMTATSRFPAVGVPVHVAACEDAFADEAYATRRTTRPSFSRRSRSRGTALGTSYAAQAEADSPPNALSAVASFGPPYLMPDDAAIASTP